MANQYKTAIISAMERIKDALLKYWGYDSFRPLQEEAMKLLVEGVDSVVVLPTGGGKSLCYQVPAVVSDGVAIVVSPLLSLMKDQVDALIECGVAAARLDSTLSSYDQAEVFRRLRASELKLLYLSPERLLMGNFLEELSRLKISFVAIDEAHCVSMWGHDFRPEYRLLGRLKQTLGGVTIAAYTATATKQVRLDIAAQLELNNPQMLVGSFDRPNLHYKVSPRNNVFSQVLGVVKQHENESGIIYCIRRKDVENLCANLIQRGYKAAPYHAGLSDRVRQESQDKFIKEEVDIVVATVAFGMGIDKSNVRYVIHTGMPKSLEHYQQESGRAGRDGLEAKCYLFYSGGDFGLWKSMLNDLPQEPKEIALKKLSDMYYYCTDASCRHKRILQYFDQKLESDNCNACDICLGDFENVEDALIVSQKILSCIVRLNQRFGAGYVALVLTGSKEKRILENAHDELSTYGLLSDFSQAVVRDWIDQLESQGYIEKYGEFNVLRLTLAAKPVLLGEKTPRLLKRALKKAKLSKAHKDSWQDVDKSLFDKLRQLRAEKAMERAVPAYVVFNDVALRDMARRKPTSIKEFLKVNGVGQKKAAQYGEEFIKVISDFN